MIKPFFKDSRTGWPARLFPGLHCLLLAVWAAMAPLAWAQTAVSEAEQRQRIAMEQAQAERVFSQQKWECSHRFAVTACMNGAIARRREAIDALNREIEVLDSNRRRERAILRLAIINEKIDALARLRPAQPQLAKPAAPTVPAIPAPLSTRTKELSAKPQDSAAAERAAAERAQATKRRQEQARQRQLDKGADKPGQKSPASTLPARPPIPPAADSAPLN